VAASSAARCAVTSAPTFPVAGSAPSTKGSCPEVCTWSPVATAGTYAATGAATAGRLRPSSASRARIRAPGSRPVTTIGSGLRAGPLEIGDQVLGVGARDDLDQLPALHAVVVEDLLGRMDQQRNGQVLPAGDCAHGASLPARPAPARTR